jgi:hypothetical protein
MISNRTVPSSGLRLVRGLELSNDDELAGCIPGGGPGRRQVRRNLGAESLLVAESNEHPVSRQ